MMGRRFQRLAGRNAAAAPAWLIAPGLAGGPVGAADPWSEPAPPPVPSAPSSLADRVGRVDSNPGLAAPPAPSSTLDAASPAPPRPRAQEPPTSTLVPSLAPAAEPTIPARVFEPADRTPSVPAVSAVVSMRAGHRCTTADGAQLWIGAAARPTPAPPTTRSPAAPSPAPTSCAGPARSAESPQTNGAPGHHVRVGVAVRDLPAGAGTLAVLARPAVSGPAVLERSVAALEPIGESEASAFAARFAADYLSFDEDDSTLRAQVLRGYFADPTAATLGWSGIGRQRADIVLAGRTLRTSQGTVVVEVTARVTPYRRTAPDPAPADRAGDLPPIPASTVGPSCAPASSAPAWVACPAQWVRIAPPVRRDPTGALVVDIEPASPDPAGGSDPEDNWPPCAGRRDEPDPDLDSVVDGGPR